MKTGYVEKNEKNAVLKPAFLGLFTGINGFAVKKSPKNVLPDAKKLFSYSWSNI